MKKYILSVIFCFGCTIVSASELSVEKQHEIIENYMFLSGQLSQSQSASFADQYELNDVPIKCGMSAASELKQQFYKFDKQIIKSTGVQLFERPNYLTDSIISPSGKFMIHYTSSGTHAVYNGVPGGASGFVDSVAQIFDDVYNHIIDTLGFTEPIHDSFYVSGGDERYDVYLVDFDIPLFGLTYPDSVMEMPNGDTLSTAYIELESDYSEFTAYRSRPLDAIRVTAAHEFFHMVQFSIDFTESEIVSNAVDGKAWMEMSSVWMEEEVYDNINDYYTYLPFFFNDPGASIQQFFSGGDLHPYASAIFPMFLSQKFDRDIVKSIWTKCG